MIDTIYKFTFMLPQLQYKCMYTADKNIKREIWNTNKDYVACVCFTGNILDVHAFFVYKYYKVQNVSCMLMQFYSIHNMYIYQSCCF